MKVLKVIDAFNESLGKFVSFLIWAGIVVLCFEVVARYVYQQPTIWAHGYTQRIFGAYFVLVGAYTLLRKDHVRVDLLLNIGSQRWRAFLDLLNFGFLVLWGAVLSYEAFWFFEDSWRFNEVDDSALRHPMWPVKLAMFVGVTAITLQGLAEAVRSIVLIFNPTADVGRKDYSVSAAR
ncbi:TRAP-type mannitol/chloroaromatic compound transport system, small permease component [Roseivivax halotolerans]|uniref:TRAP transporter small permease protein n=1 Tax=Roseivivax halotolerans TaxID=93684 RepID=A0A1I6AEI1_9RHOB|nr:TRAP transporter small permease subunit [Roseivivax halotolerans]SFQ67050.1 TRAP-type mannitol/chloroaromatic compound transport system, small permease component [Roseivivax halotolerans]